MYWQIVVVLVSAGCDSVLCVGMKEEDDLNAKVPFESSHVVVANSTGEDGWTWSKENSSYMGRMV